MQTRLTSPYLTIVSRKLSHLCQEQWVAMMTSRDMMIRAEIKTSTQSLARELLELATNLVVEEEAFLALVTWQNKTLMKMHFYMLLI